MSFLLWVLGSLLAIGLIGDSLYLAFAVTGLAGIAFGLDVYLRFPARCATPTSEAALNAKRHVLARYGWLLDIPATLLLVFPTRWMAMGFLLVVISWLLRAWTFRRVIRRTAFDVPILAVMLMVLVSLWASADLAVSVIPLGQIVAGVNVFYAVAERIQTARDLTRAAEALVGFGIVLALLAPLGVDWIKTKFLPLPQIYNHFWQILPKAIHPNLLAGALALIWPIGLAILLYAPMEGMRSSRRTLARTALALGLGLMLTILILSQSRGALAATAVGLLVLIAFKSRWAPRAVAFFLIAAIGFILSHYDLPRLADVFLSTDTISGLAGRMEIWSRAVYALQDVPFTGIGLGMFSRAVQVLYPLFSAGPDVDVGYAHNVFLQVGVDLGIPGLVAYVALVTAGFLVAGHAILTARRRGAGDIAALALGSTVSLVVIMLHGLVDSAVWDTKPALLSWVLFALVASLERIERIPPAERLTLSTMKRHPTPGKASRAGANCRERLWFEHGAQERHAIDRVLYDPPAFDQVVQAGFDFLAPMTGERVLDLGCGEGKETLQLAEQGLHVIALDVSNAQLERLRARMNGHSRVGSVSLVQADGERLPFAPGSFRLVYGKAILHHLDLRRVGREVQRVLHGTGRASFAEPLANHPLFWLARHLTPQLRSQDECPLTEMEMNRVAEGFDRIELRSFFLVAPFAYMVRWLPHGELGFRGLHALFQRLDAWLFARFPFVRRLAWYGLINVERVNREPRSVPLGDESTLWKGTTPVEHPSTGTL